MKKKQVSVSMTVMLCLLAAVCAFCGCYAMFSWHNQKVLTKLREIDAIVSQQYIGTPDQAAVADYAALGYMAGLGDRWSTYLTAQDYQDYLLRTGGQACGIGVNAVSDADAGTIRISDVFDSSPAQAAGIAIGDYIVGAADKTCEKDGVQAVLDAVRGEEGTEVTVSIRRDGTDTVEQFTLKRAVVEQHMAYGKLLDDGVGYLRINSFRIGSAAQYQTALDELMAQGVQKLVIDVRHNGGGRVSEMKDMLDPLLPEGTIMTLRTRSGKETVFSSDAEQLSVPIAVLVDADSISAAEFFAAALQEYDRATIVGAHTTGKGRAQQTYPLSDGSAIVLSEEEYFTPQGKSLAETGVTPDVEATLSDEQAANFYFLTPAQDAQLQAAIDALQ